MRGYSISNYLNFNLNYKLIIDHILVYYNDKQFNQTNATGTGNFGIKTNEL